MTFNKENSNLPAAVRVNLKSSIEPEDIIGDLSEVNSALDDKSTLDNIFSFIPYNAPPGPELYKARERLQKRPILQQYLQDFPGEIEHAVIRRVQKNSQLASHQDTYTLDGKKRPKFDVFNSTLRFHIPLITNEQAFYVSEEKCYHMKKRELWMVNNHLVHGVINDSPSIDRYHLVFDIKPGKNMEPG